jgi:uridylate kinase
VLLKLSGESLAGPKGYGIDPGAAAMVAEKIHEIRREGVQPAVVIGAGNLWRGGSAPQMDRATADHMGMLATVMNALALQDSLERLGETVRVHTATDMSAIAEPYIRRRAIHQLEKGHVVVIGAGTGNPYFTTDTAAALRAMELGAEVLIKATKVDGVYSADPRTDPGARRFDHLSYRQALALELGVMDLTAITMCHEHRMPIIVIDLWAPGSLLAAVRGEAVGTVVDHIDGDLEEARPREEVLT